jgi:methylglyoxal synthase
MKERKRIALVAHDAKKDDLIDWVRTNGEALKGHAFWSTGTTGKRIKEACPSLDLTALKSGPLGGDQQLGARIADGEIDILIFFVDPLRRCPRCRHQSAHAFCRRSTLLRCDERAIRRLHDRIAAFQRTYERPTGGGDGEPAT